MMNKIILVKKFNYKNYKDLKEENILPLIIESSNEEVIEEEYKKVDSEKNLYVINIQFIKQDLKSKIKYIIMFDDETTFNVKDALKKNENKNEKDGLLINSSLGDGFVSVDTLINSALKNKKTEPDSFTIVSRTANFQDYQILRSNHCLPFVVVLTKFQAKVVQTPFDTLYKKVRTNKDGKVIMAIDPNCIVNEITNGNISLKGITTLDGETHSIKSYETQSNNQDKCGYTLNNDVYLNIAEYSDQIINKEENPMKLTKV